MAKCHTIFKLRAAPIDEADITCGRKRDAAGIKLGSADSDPQVAQATSMYESRVGAAHFSRYFSRFHTQYRQLGGRPTAQLAAQQNVDKPVGTSL